MFAMRYILAVGCLLPILFAAVDATFSAVLNGTTIIMDAGASPSNLVITIDASSSDILSQTYGGVNYQGIQKTQVNSGGFSTTCTIESFNVSKLTVRCISSQDVCMYN